MNKEELYEFLCENTPDCGAYFLIEFDGKEHPTYISRYIKFREDGSDWFLESPCQLNRFPFKDSSDENIMKYVTELYYEDYAEEMFQYTKSMIIDGWMYEIYNGQVAPYLPEHIDSIKYITEMECLNYLLKNEKTLI